MTQPTVPLAAAFCKGAAKRYGGAHSAPRVVS
jgi:hypothetical protein